MKNHKHILNEVVLSYRRSDTTSTAIKDADTAYKTALSIFNETGCQLQLKEYFFLIMLNRANSVLGFHKLSEGGISGTFVDLRLAFATAIKCLSSGIILVHNHPSGNINPSESDIKLTQKFKKAGDILDVSVLDHIIIGDNKYYSFAENGVI